MAKAVTIDFNANIARFTSAVDKATNDLNRFQANTSRIAGNLKGILGGLGVGLAAGAFVNFIKGSIDAADKINDLSKSTGIAVGQLAGLSLLADSTGSNLEDLATAINKMSVNVGRNEEKYRKLGITSKDNLGIFKELSDIYVALDDPQTRATFGAENFGKAWQGVAPALAEGSKGIQDLVDKGEKLSGINERNAKKADEFNDRLAVLSAQTKGYGVAVAEKVIPVLERLIGIFDAGISKSATFVDKLKLIAAFGPTGALIANAFKSDDTGKQEQSGKIKKAPAVEAAANNDLNKRVCEFNGGVWDGTKCVEKKPKVGAGPKDDPTKRLLENQLNALENLVERENSLLASRNQILELFNSQGKVGISAYYQAKIDIQNEALTKTLANYDAEIKALEAFQRKANKTGKAEAQGKIDEINAKKDRAIQEANENQIELDIKQKADMEAYKESVQDVNIQILELTGNLKAAAELRFDQQNKKLSDSFTANNDEESKAALEKLRKLSIAQAQANSFEEEASRIQNELANSEERIALSRKLGAITELDAIGQVDAARQASAQSLRELVLHYQEVAIASGNPAMIQNADNLKLKLEELEASANLLAETFNKIFKDAGADAFEGFISGSKSAKEAFLDFADSVVAQINRIAAQQLAESVFGSVSSGGGLGGIFGSLFGGGGNGFDSGGQPIPNLDGSPAGGFGNFFDKLVGFLPSFDVGTDFVPKDMVAKIHKGERITPAKFNNSSMGGIMQTNHFHITGPVDQRSQTQIANAVYHSTLRSVRSIS